MIKSTKNKTTDFYVNSMVVFSFQSIISIQCTVVLANSIYSAECTNIGLFSVQYTHTHTLVTNYYYCCCH